MKNFTLRIDDELELMLWQPHHAEALYALIDANRAHLRRWMTWPDHVRSPDDQRERIRQSLKILAETGRAEYGILHHGDLVGCIGNKGAIQWPGCTEIGYWVSESAQGRGLVTRACRGLLDYLFERGDIHRVHIRAEPENVRSCAVPERLGFTCEGTMRHICRYDGRWVNHRLYSMLAEEWQLSGHASLNNGQGGSVNKA